ncbi:MAG: phosphoribosylglycinamide formyltransferase [Pseudomonadota bacterium]
MSDSASGRVAILISGRGSNLQAFLDSRDAGELPGEIALVISNSAQAEGLARADAAGVAHRVIDHRDFDNREAFDQSVLDCLLEADIELVILAGFMRIITPVLTAPFEGRLLNIHPSLLPKYPGLNTHQRALDAGDAEAGATVHFVLPELDAGPPVIQVKVPILPGDDADSLASRVLAEEHVIYPIAARWYLQGRLRLHNTGALLDGQPLPAGGIPYIPA